MYDFWALLPWTFSPYLFTFGLIRLQVFRFLCAGGVIGRAVSVGRRRRRRRRPVTRLFLSAADVAIEI
jgi:hypothetical protein